MLDTNVGEMPIDIFGDYISDCLGEEWTWEYFFIALNESEFHKANTKGEGKGYRTSIMCGASGDGFGYHLDRQKYSNELLAYGDGQFHKQNVYNWKYKYSFTHGRGQYCNDNS